MNRLTNLTNINCDIVNNRTIKYIVIHYVGAVNTAINNGNYFKSVYRRASAHYFVDEYDCVQVVEDKNVSWHSGALIYKHKECRNTNSIGIEMCCKNNGNWYFEQATVDNTIELVKELMSKYNIPVENVIRHFDVTGKSCPRPYVENEQLWIDFKNRLTRDDLSQVEELSEEDIKMYNELLKRIEALEETVKNLKGGNVVVNNVVASASFKVGQRVTLQGFATQYATGQNIPVSVRNKQYTILQVGTGKVLLKEIMSWVLNQDIRN